MAPFQKPNTENTSWVFSTLTFAMMFQAVMNITISNILPESIFNGLCNTSIAPLPFQLLVCSTLFAVLLMIVFYLDILTLKPSPKVYLLDFVCFKPPPTQMFTKETLIERARKFCQFSEENLEFIQKLLERSGLGQSTYGSEALLRQPPNPSLEEARKETEMVMFGALDSLLAKTGVKGKDIGILIVNCCIFNVVPSLSAMIVNRYKMEQNVLCYNITGMGCSAGLTAIGLAEQLLQVHPNKYALIMSTENITDNFYWGGSRSMLLLNCLIRVGGAAILLSNRPSDRHTAKYQLIHAIRTNTASFDPSYNCIFQDQDPQGYRGVTITKDLTAVAMKTVEANLTILGGLVLPTSEKILYLTNYLARRLHVANIEKYIPNFKKAVDHVITHVAAKPVLDEIERSLRLSKIDMEPSRMTLYRYGNTASSSIWYGLAYIEAKERMKRGDGVLQVAFGSGFKCVSVVWCAMRTIDREETNPWSDEIDQYPVDLSAIGSFPYYLEPSNKKV